MSFPSPSVFTGRTSAQPSDLLNISPEGTAPASRLKDAASAHEIYKSWRKADNDSAFARSQVDKMYDGEPPLDQKQLDQLGQGHRFNLNFGQAKAERTAALTAYYDIVNSVDTLIRSTINSKSQDAHEKARIIDEEFTRMLRRWPQFFFQIQRLANQFISHGVGIAYFADDIDWRFSVDGLRNFLFPRGTPANEEDLEGAIGVRKMAVHTLWRFIRNEEVARSLGWNVKAVKAVILNAANHKGPNSVAGEMKWEEFQEQIKSNDLCVGWAKATEVTLTHHWTAEFDDTVSHAIADETGVVQDFLYQCVGKFDSMTDAMVIFPYGVGNDGSIHSIRGQGYDIFNHVQAENRLRNHMLDSTFMAGSLLVQTGDADDFSSLATINVGPFIAVQGEVKISATQFPNVAADSMPVVADLANQRSNNTGTYRPNAVSRSGIERSKFEVQAEIANQSTLSSASLDLFYSPLERLLYQIFKRVINRKYRADHPGGKAVFEFRKRLLQRGVSLDDLHSVTDLVAVRAVGYGSAGARLMAYEKLKELLGALDEVGRNTAVRDLIAANFSGYQMADRYLPKLESGPRPVTDEKIAMLEDRSFMRGEYIPVTIGDHHAVHAKQHVKTLAEVTNQVESGAFEPQQAVMFYRIAIPHTEEHLAQVAMDPTREQEYGVLAKAFTGIYNIANQMEQKVTAQLRKEMEEAQAAQQQPGAGGQAADPGAMAKIAEMQMKLQQQEEMHQQRMRHNEGLWRQKLTLTDLQQAQAIALRQTKAA